MKRRMGEGGTMPVVNIMTATGQGQRVNGSEALYALIRNFGERKQVFEFLTMLSSSNNSSIISSSDVLSLNFILFSLLNRGFL